MKGLKIVMSTIFIVFHIHINLVLANHAVMMIGNQVTPFINLVLEDGESSSAIKDRWQVVSGGSGSWIRQSNHAASGRHAIEFGGESLEYDHGIHAYTFEIPQAYRSFEGYYQIGYSLKSENRGYTRIALVEQSGEVWAQKAAKGITQGYEVYGENLSEKRFELDSQFKIDNHKLDLDEIQKIFLYYIPTGNQDRYSFHIDNLILYASNAYALANQSENVPSGSILSDTVSDTQNSGQAVSSDNVKPVIEMITFDDKPTYDGDFVQEHPKISVTFRDDQSQDTGVASFNIQIVNTQDENNVTLLNILQPSTPTASFLATTNVTSGLTSSEYTLRIVVADGAGNVATKNVSFRVNQGLQIANILNGPNPFNPHQGPTRLQYQLSQNADVSIYIYSISGEQLWSKHLSSGAIDGGSIGFNAVEWDGRNHYGEVVANGVYIGYLIARDGSSKKVGKVKIAVLK